MPDRPSSVLRAVRRLAARGAPACGVLLLAACATPPRALDAGFGPQPPSPTHPTHDTPVLPQAPRIAPGYLPSRSVPMPKALRLQQTRIDALDPNVQNWEVELDLLRRGASADGDELFAIWMTGQPGEEGRTLTRLALAHSRDGARSFAPVQVESPITGSTIPFDPTVQHDPLTQRTWISAMEQTPPFVRQTWVARSAAGDSGFFSPGALVPLVGSETPDKGWLAIGPDRSDPAGSTIYLTSRNGVRVSRDDGASWEGPVALPNISNLLQPLVLADGTAVVSYLGRGSQALFVRSEDEGRSWSAPVAIHSFVADINGGAIIPGSFRTPPTTMVAQAPGGRLFAVLHDVVRVEGAEADLDLLLYSSDDGGRTWSSGRNLSTDLPPFSDQFLPWLAVDRQGRLHLAYFDTARHGGLDADADARVDVWYATSDDHGASWSRTRLTAQPIDSLGTRWSPTSNATSAQFLGDYFTLVVSDHAAYVAHPVHEGGVYGMTVSRIDLPASAGATIRDPRGLSGLWYEPATSGQGFEFNWLAGDVLALTFYGHRDSGANLFLTGVRAGRFGYGETLEIPLNAVSGGRFTQFDAGAIRNTPWGRLTLRFESCARATARLEGADGAQQLTLVRLAVAPNLPCD
jgi:hypothetical protein